MHCRATARHAGVFPGANLVDRPASARTGARGGPARSIQRLCAGCVATIGKDDGHGVIDDVTWIDAPATTLLLR